MVSSGYNGLFLYYDADMNDGYVTHNQILS